MIFASLFLLVFIALTWVRLWRPGSNRLQGSVILVERLTLLARLRMHALPVIITLSFGLLAVALGWAPSTMLLIAAVSSVLLVTVPVKYTLTEQGIRLGYSGFRRWTEFTGVRRAPGGARLLGLQRKSGMHIWLSGDRRDDEFLHFLRQTVKNAYKGSPSVIPFPAERLMPTGSGDSTDSAPMAAEG